jgi:hypothetical protein
VTNTFQTYPVNVVVPGPGGDLYVGFEDFWAEAGFSPRLFPAALDQDNSQQRSWVIAPSSGAPDITNLGNNATRGLIDSFGLAGNWMIRVSGDTGLGVCPSATPTNTPLPATNTATATATSTETATHTATATPTRVLVGHVTWQGRPTQPNTLNQLPLTLTLQLGSSTTSYPNLQTDASGFFTVPVTILPTGVYTWWAKGLTYLATNGTVGLTGAPVTAQEMGLQRAGDVNNDNLVEITDFTLLQATFCLTCGDPGYDGRADWTGDCLVDVTDFSLLRGNFGQAGAPPP